MAPETATDGSGAENGRRRGRFWRRNPRAGPTRLVRQTEWVTADATLDRLGWSRYRSLAATAGDESETGALVDDGLALGRVRRVDRGECDVSTADGELRVLSDSTRAQGETAPATGDWVLVDPRSAPAPRLVEVLPRATAIARRDPSEEVIEQVLVANVDVVGVVAAVDRPMNLAKIERFLVLAADSGAEPVVVCTKVDLGVGDEWAELPALLGDIAVVHTSASSGSGVDAVHDLVRDDRTLVLLGESGAGKSTLVNALVGSEVQRTSEVRSGDAKGRHTTTARELVLVPGGGVLIDTPGRARRGSMGCRGRRRAGVRRHRRSRRRMPLR